MQARYSQRIEIECAAMFAGDRAIGEGRVLDLSLPGCLLESSEKYLKENMFNCDYFYPTLRLLYRFPLPLPDGSMVLEPASNSFALPRTNSVGLNISCEDGLSLKGHRSQVKGSKS